jgi:hypothetical protein
MRAHNCDAVFVGVDFGWAVIATRRVRDVAGEETEGH